MLRYKYENTHDFRIKRCSDCIINNSCELHTKKMSDNASACMNGKFFYKHPNITKDNPLYIIEDIARTAQLYVMTMKVGKRNLLMDWQKPDQLKDSDLIDGPTYKEYHVMQILLSEFSKIIYDKIKYFKMEKGDNSGEQKKFIENIIGTKILVTSKNVYIITQHSDVINKLRNKCLELKCNFKVNELGKESSEEFDNEWSNIRKRTEVFAY